MNIGEVVYQDNQHVFYSGDEEVYRIRTFTIETDDKTHLCAMVATNDTLMLHQIMPPCAPHLIHPKTFEDNSLKDIVNDTRRLTQLVQAIFGLETAADNHRFSTSIHQDL